MPKAKTQPKTRQPPKNISPKDPVTAYAKSVKSGQIIAGPHVIAACERHLSDLKRKDIKWDLEAALRVLGFFADVLTVAVELVDEYGEVDSKAVPFIL